MENRRISPDLEASSSHSKYGYGEPRPLNLGCRIFISHSGRDKDFVRHLHYHLVNKLHWDKRLVFFDEKSLPTAEPISMENILAEARRCELGILVLTEDFFVNTGNPMLELQALTSSKVRLLPLFFGISVDEFKKMKCENEWEERWKEWLEGDEQGLGAWKDALNYVHKFSGLEKCKLGNSELDYILQIVDKVALIVRPPVSFRDDGVCGMDRICKKVDEMYIRCASKRTSHCQTQVVSASASTVWGDDSNSLLNLVGIYGFAGLGKSTLCRCLCDFYAADFCGRVFLLDLGSVPDSSQASSQTYSSKSAFMLRMQDLLSKLPGYNNHIQSTDFCQIQNLLRNRIIKDRIFLAIDNILPDLETLEEAHFYLDCKFARGSKVFITSRSRELLEQVSSKYTKFSAVIEHIPTLRFEEARNIFVREIPELCWISDVEDEVKECVRMCAIYPRIKLHDKHEYGKKCYHPLILKSSAASIRHFRRCNVDLKRKLRGFLQSATAVDKSNACWTAFELLDIIYAILQENERKVFLDLAVIYKVISSQLGWEQPIYVWIQTVHSHLDKGELDNILLSLEGLSFIAMENNLYALSGVRPHGLMVDFLMCKILQGADAMGFNRHFLLKDIGAQLRNSIIDFLLAKTGTRLGWSSESNALKSVRTVTVSGAQVLEQLGLRNFEGVVVLHEVVLSLYMFAEYGIVSVKVGDHIVSRHFISINESWPMPKQMVIGGQLVMFELGANIFFINREGLLCKNLRSIPSRRHVMDGHEILQPFLCNLQYLALSHFLPESMDNTFGGKRDYSERIKLIIIKWEIMLIMPCPRVIHDLQIALTNLKELYMWRCGPTIIDVTTCTNLEKMILKEMPSLRAMHAAETLTYLYIDCCRSLERISLTRMSNAGKLVIIDCPVLKSVGGLLLERYFGDCLCHGVS